jgi:hypothetical protein
MRDRIYFFFKDILNFLRECRLVALEALLPRNYYIQQLPDCVTRLTRFPQLQREMRLYNRREKYQSTRDGNRVLELRHLMDLAGACSAGDYAEVGTFRGNFAHFIYTHKAPGTTLYGFDTFAGFAAQDVAQENQPVGDFTKTSLKHTYKNIGASPATSDIQLRQGYFPETYRGLEGKTWRFVHLDVDLYKPTP